MYDSSVSVVSVQGVSRHHERNSLDKQFFLIDKTGKLFDISGNQ